MSERLDLFEELANCCCSAGAASGQKAEFRLENFEPVAHDGPVSEAIAGQDQACLVTVADEEYGPEPAELLEHLGEILAKFLLGRGLDDGDVFTGEYRFRKRAEGAAQI